jgi:GTP-binding protein
MKITSARFIRSAVSQRDFLRDARPQVAFAGKSNVGKSSLLNTLARLRRLARISSTPGCTRQINFFLVNDRFYFVDLPGYGYAKVSKKERSTWKQMVESYLLDNANLRLLILILDVRRIPDESEREFIEWLQYNRIPYAIVATKTDKLSRSAVAQQLQVIRRALSAAAATLDMIPFSAKTSDGREKILALISRALDTTNVRRE